MLTVKPIAIAKPIHTTNNKKGCAIIRRMMVITNARGNINEGFFMVGTLYVSSYYMVFALTCMTNVRIESVY
jgi:hypothetical protein